MPSPSPSLSFRISPRLPVLLYSPKEIRGIARLAFVLSLPPLDVSFTADVDLEAFEARAQKAEVLEYLASYKEKDDEYISENSDEVAFDDEKLKGILEDVENDAGKKLEIAKRFRSFESIGSLGGSEGSGGSGGSGGSSEGSRSPHLFVGSRRRCSVVDV